MLSVSCAVDVSTCDIITYVGEGRGGEVCVCLLYDTSASHTHVVLCDTVRFTDM